MSADTVCVVLGAIASIAVVVAILSRAWRDPYGEGGHRWTLLGCAAILALLGFWSTVGAGRLIVSVSEGRDPYTDTLTAVLVFSWWSFPLLAGAGVLTQHVRRRRSLMHHGASVRGRVLGTKQRVSPVGQTKSILYSFAGPDSVRRQGRSPYVPDNIAEPIVERGWIRIAYDPSNSLRHVADVFDQLQLPAETR